MKKKQIKKKIFDIGTKALFLIFIFLFIYAMGMRSW
jgi:hypothetical protein